MYFCPASIRYPLFSPLPFPPLFSLPSLSFHSAFPFLYPPSLADWKCRFHFALSPSPCPLALLLSSFSGRLNRPLFPPLSLRPLFPSPPFAARPLHPPRLADRAAPPFLSFPLLLSLRSLRPFPSLCGGGWEGGCRSMLLR